jgi:hypothetical protein
MKDDAIAQLSDQVMALTARMQEIERNIHSNQVLLNFNVERSLNALYNNSVNYIYLYI